MKQAGEKGKGKKDNITSGDVDLTLPEDASFTLNYHSAGGKFSPELPYRTEDGRDLFGDGMSQYGFSTVSGQARITVIK